MAQFAEKKGIKLLVYGTVLGGNSSMSSFNVIVTKAIILSLGD
jgi:hypothetical protein